MPLWRRWKPQKTRPLAAHPDSPTVVRFHRACSWLARVEQSDSNNQDVILSASHSMLAKSSRQD
jgi:hypothetical protein